MYNKPRRQTPVAKRITNIRKCCDVVAPFRPEGIRLADVPLYLVTGDLVSLLSRGLVHKTFFISFLTPTASFLPEI